MFSEEKTLSILQRMLDSRIDVVTAMMFPEVQKESISTSSMQNIAFVESTFQQVHDILITAERFTGHLERQEAAFLMLYAMLQQGQSTNDREGRSQQYEMICGKLIVAALLLAHIGKIDLSLAAQKETFDYFKLMDDAAEKVAKRKT